MTISFIAYTLESGQAQWSNSDSVNAQPAREILSMMTVKNGKIWLHLPGTAQPLQVDTWIEVPLECVEAATALTVGQFRAEVKAAKASGHQPLLRFQEALAAREALAKAKRLQGPHLSEG